MEIDRVGPLLWHFEWKQTHHTSAVGSLVPVLTHFSSLWGVGIPAEPEYPQYIFNILLQLLFFFFKYHEFNQMELST